jgi:hypothetical protein
MAKISSEAMKEPISPTMTRSLYVSNTSHREKIISASLINSALNAAYSASPADFALLREATATKISPAAIPIEPPRAAEIAPCLPANQADNNVTAAVDSI